MLFTLRHYCFYLIILSSLLICCSRPDKITELPILGPFERIDGQKRYYPVPDFQLTNQQGDTINAKTFENKLRLVDFFFTSCPTICPKVQAQMLRIQKIFSNESSLQLISHSIDTKRDTVERLAKYAKNLGIHDIAKDNWHFVTGNKDEIFELADDYFSIVYEDPSAPGGFNHSGRIVLVDKEGYIRAFANGLDIDSVERLIKNIKQLLDTYEQAEEN